MSLAHPENQRLYARQIAFVAAFLLPASKLLGLTEGEIRSHSHRPQDFYGQPHFMPSASDGELMARLNRCRCAARDAELRAVAAFVDGDGCVLRADLLQAVNRLSSVLYILMIQCKAGKAGG